MNLTDYFQIAKILNFDFFQSTQFEKSKIKTTNNFQVFQIFTKTIPQSTRKVQNIRASSGSVELSVLIIQLNIPLMCRVLRRSALIFAFFPKQTPQSPQCTSSPSQFPSYVLESVRENVKNVA
jgi:hypothetical protein